MVSGFVLDAQQRVVQWNPRYVQLFPGWRRCWKVGEPFGELKLRYSVDMLMPLKAARPSARAAARRLHGLLQPDGGSFELYQLRHVPANYRATHARTGAACSRTTT